MIKGYLTNMLSKENQDKGYGLTEDGVFLYLYKDEEEIATFTINNTLQQVESFIIGYEA